MTTRRSFIGALLAGVGLGKLVGGSVKSHPHRFYTVYGDTPSDLRVKCEGCSLSLTKLGFKELASRCDRVYVTA